MKKRLPIIIIILIAAARWACICGAAAISPGRTTDIQVSGNLELTLVDLSFKIAGRMTELNVQGRRLGEEGPVDRASRSRATPRAALPRRAGRLGAQSNYEQFTTSIAISESHARKRHRGPPSGRRSGASQARRMLAGSRPQEIQQAEAAVADAKAQLDLARADWDRAQTLYKNEDISTQQFDQARTKFR